MSDAPRAPQDVSPLRRAAIGDGEAVTTTDRLLKTRSGKLRYHTRWCTNAERINDPQRQSRAALAADVDWAICSECATDPPTTPKRLHDQAALTRLADISLGHDTLATAQHNDRRGNAVPKAVTEAMARRASRLGALPAPGQLYIYPAVRDGVDRRDWQWLASHDSDADLTNHGPAADHEAFGGREGVRGRDRHGTRHVWSTPPALARVIVEHRRPDDHPHPCMDDGHRGIRNLGGGEFTCTTDDCDRRFGRDVAEAIAEADTA